MTGRTDVRVQPDEATGVEPLASSRWHGRVLGTLIGLSTATQLRTPGAAGPFEVLVVLYSAGLLFRAGPRLESWRPQVGRLLGVFIIAGSLGGLLSIMAGWSSPTKVMIGLLPYLFALVGLEVVARNGDRRTLLRSWLFCFGTVVLLSQLFLYLAYLGGQDSVGPIELFVGDRERKVRLLGWTNNPNQLAIQLSIAGAAIGLSTRSSVIKGLAFAVVMTVGIATGSDGLKVAAVAGVALVALAVIAGRTRVPQYIRWLVAAVVVAGGLFVAANAGSLVDSARTTAEDGDQAEERFELWASCLPAIVQSPLVGLGPGGHGELNGQPRSCHNTYVEAATFGGAPVVIYLIWLMGVLALRQANRGELMTLFMFGQMAVQMVFSFFFRYPQLWMLLLALELGVLVRQTDSAAAHDQVGGIDVRTS